MGEACDLAVEVAGIKLRNPVMTASGTFGYGEEYAPLIDLNALGAVVVKTTTLEPRPGNPPPRLIEVAGGMLSSCGLQNVGLEAFIRDKLPFLRQYEVPVIVSLGAETSNGFRQLAQRLDKEKGVAGLELNLSCPNVKSGGMALGTDPDTVAEVVQTVKEVTTLPVIAKLTPNVTDIVRIALAAQDAGADAVTLINGLWGMSIDPETRRPRLGNITGGLTGPAIKPVAVRMVWQVAQVLKIPIIGVGGITSAEDALEFIIAGATAIQVGTANFVQPLTCLKIIDGLKAYLIKHGYTSIREVIRSLEL